MNNPVSTLRSAVRQGKAAVLALLAAAALLPAQAGQDLREPTLPPGCEELRAPAGNVVSLHTFAQGVQIYQWDASISKWVFQEPAAFLYADAGYSQPIGVHFRGPTWMSNSGSSVVGAFYAGKTVDPSAIAWLLLSAVRSAGPGPFAGTTFIQRVNTTGGLAPARRGTPNERVYIPYTAEYYFYRAQ